MVKPAKAKAKKPAKKKPAKKKTPVAAKIVTSPMPNAGRKVKDFERALDAEIEKDPKPVHGGKRHGAGRPAAPEFMEAGILDAAELHTAVKEMLKAPFDLWAARAEIADLSLTDAEADMIAKPTVVLLDHYAPNLPPVTIAWGSLAVSAVAIMRPRIEILKTTKSQQGVKPGETSDGSGGAGKRTVSPRPQAAVAFSKDKDFKTTNI